MIPSIHHQYGVTSTLITHLMVKYTSRTFNVLHLPIITTCQNLTLNTNYWLAGETRYTKRTLKNPTSSTICRQRYTIKSKSNIYRPFCSRNLKERRRKSRKRNLEALFYTQPLSLGYRRPCQYLIRSRLRRSPARSCRAEGPG